MGIRFGTDKKVTTKKPKVIGKLRRTQLITTFGVGSIVDMPGYSSIIAATDYWSNQSSTLHDPNLEKLLNVKCFKAPPTSMTTRNEIKPDLPSFRFPIMHFCPECGRLMPYWEFGDDEGKRCNQCHNKNIVPSRFIAACINGHLEDFPYHWWVHHGDYKTCPIDFNHSNLKISFSNESGGLDSIIITCTKCGKKRSMAGSLGRNALQGYHCKGKRPWIGFKKETFDPIKCEAPMRGLHRGASNVYFAIIESALTIPPWSTNIQQIISESWEKIETFYNKHPTDEKIKEIIEYEFTDLIEAGHYTTQEILTEIKKRITGKSSKELTKQNLYEQEYKVLDNGNHDDPNDMQFRSKETEVPEYLKKYIDKIVLITRLREVMALRGFRRIYPEKPNEEEDRFKGFHFKEGFIPLSNTRQEWLPGIELLGEGIFIKLNDEKTADWESKVTHRYLKMKERLDTSNVECDHFSPKYVLLHTLSHLLIRQLSIECGYSGASIKERIYSTYQNSDTKMTGILLYTSAADSDGSLGGLVHNGIKREFGHIFRNMLQEASWCSSDPICVQSMAQGYDSLNYAACHACTLLPETSCEMRNCLLDRCSIIGTLDDKTIGYFGKLLLQLDK